MRERKDSEDMTFGESCLRVLACATQAGANIRGRRNGYPTLEGGKNGSRKEHSGGGREDRIRKAGVVTCW